MREREVEKERERERERERGRERQTERGRAFSETPFAKAALFLLNTGWWDVYPGTVLWHELR